MLLWLKQKFPNSIPSVALQMSAKAKPARQFEVERDRRGTPLTLTHYWFCGREKSRDVAQILIEINSADVFRVSICQSWRYRVFQGDSTQRRSCTKNCPALPQGKCPGSSHSSGNVSYLIGSSLTSVPGAIVHVLVITLRNSLQWWLLINKQDESDPRSVVHRCWWEWT